MIKCKATARAQDATSTNDQGAEHPLITGRNLSERGRTAHAFGTSTLYVQLVDRPPGQAGPHDRRQRRDPPTR